MVLEFSQSAYADYRFWEKNDLKKFRRIQKLCGAIKEKSFQGIGKPEPLKFSLQGYWSRRIDKTNRLVYTIRGKKIIIISCRYHY